jgi:exodeoxyribonuclease V alpha subunit
MINATCKIIKQIFAKDDFRIFGCQIISGGTGIKVNRYGNITIKGELSYLSENKIYELCLEALPQTYNGETQYEVVSVPSMENISIKDMSEDDDLAILNDITSKDLAKEIHSVYPHYCQMILRNEPIDLDKIKGVKGYRHEVHKRKLNERFVYYNIINKFREYKLTIKDCKELFKLYDTSEKVVEQLNSNPYFCLVAICRKAFLSVDKLILKEHPGLIDSDVRCELYIYYILTNNENNGNTYMSAIDMANNLPSNLIIKSKDVVENSELFIYDEINNVVAIASTYNAEQNIANFINNINNNHTDFNWECNEKTHPTLTNEQRNVLTMFSKNGIIILDAKAGTGKTFTMFSLIELCGKHGMECRLFAPTGRAAKRLSELTEHDASTIHRGTSLGMEEIYDDVIIIDEASMLNLSTMSMLVKSIKNEHAHIIFIMDIEQLPPIGLGYVAKEMIDSGVLPICTLTKVFRFDSSGLMKVTTLARNGENYLKEVSHEKFNDYSMIPFTDLEQITNVYLKQVEKSTINDVCVITPRNIGEYGTYNINNHLQNAINPIKKNEKFFKRKLGNFIIKFHENDKVMVTKNNYETLLKDSDEMQAVFNGEMGRVLKVCSDHLEVEIDDKIFIFFQDDIENLLLGYCTTVYKFQGSQIDYPIILTLNEYKNQLNKNLLYTALSRGQKQLIEIGEESAIEYALSHTISKQYKNNLCKMLQEGKSEKTN